MRLVSEMRPAARAGTWRRAFVAPLLAAALIGVAVIPAIGQEDAAVSADPESGQKLFGQKGCNGCHKIDGVGGQVGPDLTGAFNLDLANDRPEQPLTDIRDYVRESIQDPQAYIVPGFPQPSPMPEFELSEQEIADLIAYLETAGQAEAN